MSKATVYYAIKMSTGGFVAGAGNSSLPTPRLYLTPQAAENAVKRHWPGIRDRGYTIVRLIVDSKWEYKHREY